VEVEAIAPATAVITPAPRRQLTEPTATLPPLDFELPTPVKRPCPAAGPFDFPDLDTGVEPQGRPAEATYDWKRDGSVVSGPGEFKIDDFETRRIMNVDDHPTIPDAFTYEEERKSFVDERQNRNITIVTRFRVVPQPAVRNEQVPNDVGKGFFIEGQVTTGKDSQGNEFRQELTFVPAIQLAAYPIRQGTAFESTGTDLATGIRVTIRGVVKDKKQIDACGDRVDSWLMDAEQIITYPAQNGQTETLHYNYDFGLAPQYGSIIVFEHVDAPIEGPVASIDFRIGRVPSRSGG
jgi:hypothetical protein